MVEDPGRSPASEKGTRTDATPLPPRIGEFEIERRLSARQDFSTVYVARDPRRGEHVALRVLDRLGERPEAVRTLRQAMSLRRGLMHPGLVPIVDAGQAPQGAWIAMPLLATGNLADLLEREGRLSLERSLAILEPVAGALDAAHTLGMVCDSLTPRAVLVVGIPGLDERGVLTDVGPPWPATLRRGRMLGDTDGLSPEEIRGDPPSAPSNMYALGALLVRCLTGEPPFPGRSRTAALAAHLAAPPPRVSERVSRLPAALDDVVAAAMAKDPQERYRSAGELIASAARSLGGDLPQGAVAGGDRAPVAGVGAVGHVAARRVTAAPAARSRAARAARGVALVTPAVALIAVGVVAAVHAGGNGSKDNVTRSVTRPAHPPASTVASASLAPPAATGSVLEPGGAVRVMSRGGRSVITIAAERLPPERRTPREAYAVWLYNSRRSAVRLGFVVPPVGAGGRFVNHRDLPPDAARYRRVVVTSEQGIGPLPKGPIVLEGALPLPASPQPPG